jgi:hypothetical protein
MEPIAAYQTAFRRVLDRQFYDADYDLPNWNKFVSNEMYRLCPAEYYKLVNALAGEEKKIAVKKKAAAEAKRRAIIDAKKRVANVDWLLLIDSAEKAKVECVEASIYLHESQITACEKAQQAFQNIVNIAGPQMKACWTPAMAAVVEATALSNANNRTSNELRTASISRGKILDAFDNVAKNCANPIIK